MTKMSEKSKIENDAVSHVQNAARKDRERILLQDRVDRTYADEMRRTERALEWQRSPTRVTARRTGSVLRVLYYTALAILTPFTMGLVLIPHFVIKKLFFDKRG